jgi:hypothetical protein
VKGAVYDGDWVNGMYEGLGSYVDEEGDRYEGFWKEGKLNGKGKYPSN